MRAAAERKPEDTLARGEALRRAAVERSSVQAGASIVAEGAQKGLCHAKEKLEETKRQHEMEERALEHAMSERSSSED